VNKPDIRSSSLIRESIHPLMRHASISSYKNSLLNPDAKTLVHNIRDSYNKTGSAFIS
jgi:hypothetical protein